MRRFQRAEISRDISARDVSRRLRSRGKEVRSFHKKGRSGSASVCVRALTHTFKSPLTAPTLDVPDAYAAYERMIRPCADAREYTHSHTYAVRRAVYRFTCGPPPVRRVASHRGGFAGRHYMPVDEFLKEF